MDRKLEVRGNTATSNALTPMFYFSYRSGQALLTTEFLHVQTPWREAGPEGMQLVKPTPE